MFDVILCTNQQEIFDHLKLRHDVFVLEQKVTMEEEFDFLDRNALLFSGLLNGKIIATARVLLYPNYAKIGRFAVLKEYRKKHYGTHLIESIEQTLVQRGITEVRLSSQLYAKPFYETFGYTAYGAIYLDANILHTDMVKKIK
jgi:predicted GNAT family N-acyltransferase